MIIPSTPSIKNGFLVVRGKAILTQVPHNITIKPISHESAFFGASSDDTPSSRLNFSLGILKGYKFVCLFRFKMWWMIPSFGESGCEVPPETQMLLMEAVEDSRTVPDGVSEPQSFKSFYVLVLPLLDGRFRSSLQGTVQNELLFCVESGDPNVKTSQVTESVFMNSGDSPYKLIKSSIKMLEKHKGTFSHIENKPIPAHIDWFGWSTWDAFYCDVSPQGIEEGLKSFAGGGYSPKFFIIDDGWQNTVRDFIDEGEPHDEHTRLAARLVNLEENPKFKVICSDKSCFGLRQFIKTIKQKYGVRLVYAWHTILGYWGGVLTTSEVMRKYNPKTVYPTPSNIGHVECAALANLEKYGVGLIDPSKIDEFYNDLHSYLVNCGVDGVKVDVKNITEVLGSGYGGRVSLSMKFQQALEDSVMKNFKSNNLICSMSQNTECIFSSKKSATARMSEDFMPNEPTFQTLHIAAVAFNSLLMGEIVIPDWDMFCTNHCTAEFHGAARAVGGCAVYVSDIPGQHNFDVIKKLVLPDGSILRARYAGRPTRDCLFIDPVTDEKSLLKIWNLNKLTGVIGIFNCQRAGKWPPIQGAKDIAAPGSATLVMSGSVRPLDVDLLEEAAHESWKGDCAIYSFNSGSLVKMPKESSFEVSLGTLKFDIFTISPIRVFGQDHCLQFAPIGLLDMYNSGGTVQSLHCKNDVPSSCEVKVQVRGCGRFGAYSNRKPRSCFVDMEEKLFFYNAKDGLLTINLGEECRFKEIEIVW